MPSFASFFTIVFDYVFVIQMLTVSLAAAYVLTPPDLGRGYSVRMRAKSLALFALKIAALFASETVVNLLLHMLSAVAPAFAGINYPLAHLLSGAFYTAVFCRFPIKARVSAASVLFTDVIVIAELGRRLSNMLGGADWMIILSYVLILALAVPMRIMGLERFSHIPPFAVVLTAVDCAMSSVIVIVYTSMFLGDFPDSKANDFFCLVLVGLYIVSFVTYVFVYSICRKHDESLLLVAENRELRAEKYILGLSRQSMEDMRMMRHDMKNLVRTMRIMLDEGQYDKLKEYFDGLSEDVLRPASVIDSGNPMLDAVLNMESAKARTCGIEADIRAVVPPRLPFADIDICRLLSNLMDNAIEAIERGGESERVLTCFLHADDEYLYICVKNAFVREEGKPLLDTSKGDAERHGLGHKIVERIAEKYGGYVNYSAENGEFIAEAALDLHFADAKKNSSPGRS